MSYRYMRILVMFDLPVTTAAERRAYTLFRKYLLKNGFLMLQESVYCKIAQNPVAADSVIDALRKNKPPTGLVQLLRVTEKQYAKMEYIAGESQLDVLNDDRRLVVL